MRLRVWLASAMVVAAVLAPADSAQAATGTIGSYDPTLVQCFPGSIYVAAPYMTASSVSPAPGTVVIGPSHVQWVAYKASLVIWNGSQWTYSTGADGSSLSSGWRVAQVTDEGTIQPESWYDVQSGTWNSTLTSFSIAVPGSYAIWTEYYWYGDNSAPAGYDAGYVSAYLDFTSFERSQGEQSYCIY